MTTLAMTSDLLRARGRDKVVIFVVVKTAAEALQQPRSWKDCGESILVPVPHICLEDDLLDHLDRFLLNGFEIFV